MRGPEFRKARLALDLSQPQLAKALEVEGGDRTIRKWETGERPVPGPVAVLMRLALALPQVQERFWARASGQP